MSLISREACPQCRLAGNDTRGDNLLVYENGSKHCQACGYHEYGSGGEKFSSMPAERYDLPDLTPVELGSRRLDPEVTQRYGVGEYNESLYFPYYDMSGKCIGAKCRKIGPDGITREFYWEGNAGDATWFGLNNIPSKDLLVLTEGETDQLTVAELIPEATVLGLGKGANSAEKTIKSTLGFLRTFKKIVILFDNDEAGHRATEAAKAALPQGKTYVGTLPTGVKDCNQLHTTQIEGHPRSKEVVRAVRAAQRVEPDKIWSPQELVAATLEQWKHEHSGEIISTGIPGLDRLTGGLRLGAVTTLLADTGIGKSTLSTFIADSASRQVPVFFIPLEMTGTEMLLRFTEMEIREPVFKDPKRANCSDDELEQAAFSIANRVYFSKNFGSMSVEELAEAIEVATTAYDCKVVVLDHLTAAATTTSGGLEWKLVDAMITMLKSVAGKCNVSILCVSHITAPAGSKDKDGDRELQLSEARGSKGIGQNSDCVLGMRGERSSNLRTVSTLKLDRRRGEAGEVKLEYRDFGYVEVTQEHEQVQQQAASLLGSEAAEPVRESSDASEQSRPEGVLRERPDYLQGGEEVQAGHQAEPDQLCGGEGDVLPSRQEETPTGEAAAPALESKASLPGFSWDYILNE